MGSMMVSHREKTESAGELEEMGRSMRLYLMRHGIAIDTYTILHVAGPIGPVLDPL